MTSTNGSPAEVKAFNISYSLLSLFRNCRKAAEFTYIKGLRPNVQDQALEMGTLVHLGLQTWYDTKNVFEVENVLSKYKGKISNEEMYNTYWHTLALLNGYVNHYGTENDMEIIATEKTIEYPIVDSDTNKPIPGVIFYGRIDGIVRVNNEYFVLENKTTSSLTTSYLDKLWSDFQNVLYYYYASKAYGIKCDGIRYNVILKSNLKKNNGESEVEFNLRKEMKVSKNKSGKSNISQKLSETDEEYYSRLLKDYSKPEKYYREDIYITQDIINTTIREVSELVKAFITSYKRNRFYKNTDHCFKYNKPCPFFKICRSGDNPNIISNYYTTYPRKGLHLLYTDEEIL